MEEAVDGRLVSALLNLIEPLAAVTVLALLLVVAGRYVVNDRHSVKVLLATAIGAVPAFIGIASLMGVPGAAAIVWGGRLATLLLYVSIGLGFLRARRSQAAKLRGGRGLWLAGMAFVTAGMASQLIHGQLSVGGGIGAALLTVTWLAADDWETLACLLRRVAAITVVASAVAVALGLPDAVSGGYSSVIGVPWRASGVTAHANTLGPMMLFYLLLEKAAPSRSRFRTAGLITAAMLLVLAQSKTAWAAALVVALILWAGRASRGWWTRIAILLAAIGIVAAAVVVTDEAVDEQIADPSSIIEPYRSLTGRTDVWAYGLGVWRERPLIGGGGSVFQDYADRTGAEWAAQAHNQYVQTVSRYGLLALVGLLLYITALVYYGFKLGPATRYVSLALVAVLLVRTLTESTLDGFHFFEFITFSMLVAYSRRVHEEDAWATADIGRSDGETAGRTPRTGAGASVDGPW